jgi:hypothetical protein
VLVKPCDFWLPALAPCVVVRCDAVPALRRIGRLAVHPDLFAIISQSIPNTYLDYSTNSINHFRNTVSYANIFTPHLFAAYYLSDYLNYHESCELQFFLHRRKHKTHFRAIVAT